MMRKTGVRPGRLDYATYLGYTGYAAGSEIIPMILLPMAAELNFSLASGGALHLIRSAVMIVSMALSGRAAARFGKRRTLGTAMVLIAAGMLLCGFTSGYAMLVGAIFLVGLGNGFFESLATGFTQDLHRNDSPNRYINITHSFWPLGILLTVLGAGWWLQQSGSWRALPLIIAMALLLPAILYFCFGKNAEDPVPVRKYRWSQITGVIREPRFLCFLGALFLAGGSEHCFIFWIPSFVKLEFGGGDFVRGVGVMLFAGGMFLGRLVCGAKLRAAPGTVITGGAIFCALTALVIPHLSSPGMLLGILLLLGVATGPLWPNLQYCCASVLPHFDNSLLYMLMPLFGIPGCGLCTYLLGVTAEKIGMRNGFYVVFFCNLLIAVLMVILGKLKTKQRR